jgi:ATP-dependent DNA helicase RecG
VLTDTNQVLLNNLKLTDNGYLKRAAILLFHPDPEKFV